MKSPARSFAVGWLVLAILGMPLAASSGPDTPAKKLKVVVFGGHPDDPESGPGGLVAMLTRQGHEVILAHGTAYRGDRLFFDRPEAEVRREEAAATCKVLGAEPKFFPYAHEKLICLAPRDGESTTGLRLRGGGPGGHPGLRGPVASDHGPGAGRLGRA